MTVRHSIKQYQRNIRIIPFLLFTLFLFACGKAAPPPRLEFVLGTVCSVNLFEFGNEKLYSDIFVRVWEIDRTMNATGGLFGNQLSTLILINQNAGIAPVQIGDDLLDVLQKAKYYAELSKGAFDPTIGPLVSLWGIGTDAERVPEAYEIEQALSLVDWRDLILDREQGTAFLRQQGMKLDLGAIAKGYAADEVIRIAKEAKAVHGIIDMGGNIVALGGRDKNRRAASAPWRIGIQDPLGQRGTYIGVLLAADKSVVTSGVYERYFEIDGKTYHHILSTEDGYPVDNGLLSVTIIADQSIDADGLSTSVFALGFQKGLDLLKTIPNTEAIFIFDDCSVFITDNLKKVFSITNNKYKLSEAGQFHFND